MLIDLKTQTEAQTVLNSGHAFIFKHSTRCPVSAWAHQEVISFVQQNPEQPVYLLKVVEDRPVSQWVAAETQVQHESPQILQVQKGEVIWSASHGDITNAALQKRIEA
jgi:bacillithiol system protein YtxJ